MSSALTLSSVCLPWRGGSIHAVHIDGKHDAGRQFVLVHGADRTHQNAQHWKQHFQWLAAESSGVFALDLPGHGLSDPRPPIEPAPDMNSKFAALLEFLRSDAVGSKPVVLFGRSLGGRLALRAAAEAPDRVAALVLIAPAVTGEFMESLPVSVRSVPSLIVWAEDDPIVPFGTAATVHGLMAKSMVVSLGKVREMLAPSDAWRAHSPENEHVDMFKDAVHEFLATL